MVKSCRYGGKEHDGHYGLVRFTTVKVDRRGESHRFWRFCVVGYGGFKMANQTQWWLGLDVVDRRKFDDGWLMVRHQC